MKMAIDFVMFFNVASCFFRRFETKCIETLTVFVRLLQWPVFLVADILLSEIPLPAKGGKCGQDEAD